MFSVALHEGSPQATLEALHLADSMGVPGAWLTSAGPDQLSLLAAAAVGTSQIPLGTAIVPIFPRHPLVTAQAAGVVEALAPGRLRLGVGTSHRSLVEGWHGLPFDRPLGHLREYVEVLRRAFTGGGVSFHGQHYRVDFPVALPTLRVPVLTAALRPAAFALAGEISDGAIAWICPADYLRERARPALIAGAERALRQRPPLLAHAFLTVHPDEAAVRAAYATRLGGYLAQPFYRAMLEEAGRAPTADALVDAVVAWGPAERCREWLQRFAQESAADEVIVSLMPLGADRAAALRVAMRVVSGVDGSASACPE